MDKLEYFVSQIDDIIGSLSINKIIVEEALAKFTRGASSAHTINSLIAFNFAIRYEFYKRLGVKPEGINVSTARKQAGIKFPKTVTSIKDKNKRRAAKKEYIADLMEERYSELYWPRKRTGRHKDWNYDVADSIVLAEAIL